MISTIDTEAPGASNGSSKNSMAKFAVNDEIVTCYEKLKMTPEEIAQDLDLQPRAVEAVLCANSAMFRAQTTKEERAEIFSDQDMIDAANVIKNSMHSDDDHVAFRAARFIIDEKKGRNDARADIGKNVSALTLSDKLASALEAANKALVAGRAQKVIDVWHQT